MEQAVNAIYARSLENMRETILPSLYKAFNLHEGYFNFNSFFEYLDEVDYGRFEGGTQPNSSPDFPRCTPDIYSGIKGTLRFRVSTLPFERVPYVLQTMKEEAVVGIMTHKQSNVPPDIRDVAKLSVTQAAECFFLIYHMMKEVESLKNAFQDHNFNLFLEEFQKVISRDAFHKDVQELQAKAVERLQSTATT